MRKHYMTLCLYNNTEITHIVNKGNIEITFEQPVNGGFKDAVFLIDGTNISNDGFNNSELDFFGRFVKKNAEVIGRESRGEL